MPPPDRPGGPRQLKPIDELTADEATVELARIRSGQPSDEDFETILAADLKQFEESRRRSRELVAERITALEQKVQAG